jgi:hypothetical protein
MAARGARAAGSEGGAFGLFRPRLVMQASVLDGFAFNPFSFQQESYRRLLVTVGVRRQRLELAI